MKGGSTQLHGVTSDIVLPSLTDSDEIGEGSLKNRLPYDEVAPVKIADSMSATPLFSMNCGCARPSASPPIRVSLRLR